MFSGTLFYIFVCLLLFGIGDILGAATKARLSAVFVSLILFLIGFMSGILPPNIIELAGLTEMGKWALIFVVFSMGTTINMKELIAEWRTVLTAVLSMVVLIVGGLVLVPVIGYNETVVSIPIINGGIVATQMMTTAAMDKGLNVAAALGAVLYAVQKFFGTPVASYFGLRAAKTALEEYRRTGVNPYKPTEIKEVKGKQSFYEQHKKYYGNFASLAIVAFFSWIAVCIGKMTGVSGTIWALLLGALMGSTGLVPPKILEHAKSSGIFNVGVFATIIPSLGKIKMDDLLFLSYSTIIVFIVVFAVLFLFFYILPLWKILGSRNIAMGVAVTQLLGFPATYLVASEVAQAAGETDEERQVVLDAIMPKYLVGGFATVTTFSVILAGIFEKFL